MITVLEGAALSTEIALIRDATTGMAEFRNAVFRIGLHLAAETSKHLPTQTISVNTPLETTQQRVLSGDVNLVPVLRAGLGLLDPFLQILPSARVGFEGLRRDEETLQPIEYYRKMPPTTAASTFIVIDPMLATGGSLAATITHLKEHAHTKILAACLIAAPEGIARIEKEHSDVHIVVAAVDRELNSNGYILPGLGDAGDRLFGTV